MTDEIMLSEEEELSENSIKDMYLSFYTDGGEYALDVANVKEVQGLSIITAVPNQPDFVKGIINLRGDIVPVIEVRKRFLKPEKNYDDKTCIIIINYDDEILGLIVDEIKGVYTITEENIASPPSVRLSHENIFVKNIGMTEDGVKLLLDIDKLLLLMSE